MHPERCICFVLSTARRAIYQLQALTGSPKNLLIFGVLLRRSTAQRSINQAVPRTPSCNLPRLVRLQVSWHYKYLRGNHLRDGVP